MSDEEKCERAVALVNQGLDVLRRADEAPTSPLGPLRTAKERRAFRRAAEQLRQGKTAARYPNLHNAEEEAALYERTIRRDEILEQALHDFEEISRELGLIVQENPPGFVEAMRNFALEAQRLAEEQGPGSEAARRLRHVHQIAWLANRHKGQSRRGRPPASSPPALFTQDPAVMARYALSAAQILTSPPSPEETVISIPPEDRGSGQRLHFRIGLGPASWIGCFELGPTKVSTIDLMPDGKHLFVSAGGAGYVIDARSHTLVEALGTEVVVVLHRPRKLLVLSHQGMSLEAFGPNGRLWKTPIFSAGALRRVSLAANAVVGEALFLTMGWGRFSVKLETGEVEMGGMDVRLVASSPR